MMCMSDSPGLPAIFAELTEGPLLARVLACAVEEDLGSPDGCGDLTTASLPDAGYDVTAHLVAREPGVVSGLAVWPQLADAYRPRFPGRSVRLTAHVDDGARVAGGAVLGELCGALDLMLAIERPLLNLLGRLCGIATFSAACVEAIAGTHAVVCDTRKTTPGLRCLEKYAVACGGGTLHRFGLFDAALYKDNHLAALGTDRWAERLAEAIAKARAHRPGFVEVEVDSLEQLDAILAMGGAGPDIVLLDNFAPPDLLEAVRRRNAATTSVCLEASGGITPETIRAVAETGVDRISVGALTHSVRTLDIGLDMSPV